MALKVKQTREVLEATCDSCGGTLKDFIDRDETEFNTNYAELKPSFGYGSGLDLHGECGFGPYTPPERFSTFLCAECYKDALAFLGLELAPVNGQLLARKREDA